jgi:hypothetical protein
MSAVNVTGYIGSCNNMMLTAQCKKRLQWSRQAHAHRHLQSHGEPDDLLGNSTLALHVHRAEYHMSSSSFLRSPLTLILRLPGPPLGNLALPSLGSLESHGRSRSEADSIDPLAVVVWVEQ